MIKFAVIPWADKYNKNELFNVLSSTNKNGLAEPYAEMKEFIEKSGNEINTIDQYDDLSKVDFFLFFDWFPKWITKLTKMGLADRMVYCNAEPPTVRALNTKKGYETVKRYFPYIMTWNKELIDNKRFFYRTIPYNFTEHEKGSDFENKKLLTSISANKKSDYIDELYTERERVISYFEDTIPAQFDMYGVGWENSGHRSYKGRPDSKFDTYKNYKFAIAFENTKNVRGYVTEKIFDCLTGNIVPIYFGADDICEYVSDDCFIDYRKFESLDDLRSFLESITEETYENYLRAARKAIASNELRYKFSGSMYGENILALSQNAKMQGFKVSAIDVLKLNIRWFGDKASSKGRKIIGRIVLKR